MPISFRCTSHLMPHDTHVALSSNHMPLGKREIDPKALEQFKIQLQNFHIRQKGLNHVAEKLCEIIPQHLSCQDLVNLIFEYANRHSIIHLLDAVLFINLTFILSPYDELRRAIVEDHNHVLSNDFLPLLFQKYGVKCDEEKLKGCYDLAYRINHPYIYPPSQTSILSHDDYTLNFLWINLNPQDRIQNIAQNIFKDGLDSAENDPWIKDPVVLRALEKTESSLKEDNLDRWLRVKQSSTYRISKWADVHPNAEINLWYDSALVTQQAQQKTFDMMQAISQSRKVNITMRDIRQLPNLFDEIAHSLHPGTPVYYRVDIVKAAIADFMTSSAKTKAKFCVVSDTDIEPMSPKQMFDQRTMKFLSSNGYVFNRVGADNFENSFFIFNKDVKSLQDIHLKTLILKTDGLISSFRDITPYESNALSYPIGSQFVYKLYSDFLKKMGEPLEGHDLEFPRKVVKCPKSQFNQAHAFSPSDYKAESFRFIGTSNIPYTINGRSYKGQIEELVNWKAEPLQNITEKQ